MIKTFNNAKQDLLLIEISTVKETKIHLMCYIETGTLTERSVPSSH